MRRLDLAGLLCFECFECFEGPSKQQSFFGVSQPWVAPAAFVSSLMSSEFIPWLLVLVMFVFQLTRD